jgi:hypothetical protein
MAATKDLPVCYSGEIHPLFFFWPILFLRESKIIGIFSGFMEYSGRASPVAMPRALPASRELQSFAVPESGSLDCCAKYGDGRRRPEDSLVCTLRFLFLYLEVPFLSQHPALRSPFPSIGSLYFFCSISIVWYATVF